VALYEDVIDIDRLAVFKSEADDEYQASLVSGTNIKTVNGESLLGSGDLTVGGSGASVFYGTCATAAATAAKAVVCEEFTSADLVAGTVINVYFTTAQTYNGAPTLNVNGTGAKNVKRVGSTNAARYEWQAGEVLQFVYDGSYWMLTDGGIATTTYYGVTKLSSATNSTSNSLAATASAVKAAYDLANGKQDALVSGTNIKTINGNSILGSGDLTVGGGGTGGMTVRGARVTVPKRTSTAQSHTVAVNGLGGIDAHDIVLFFGTGGYDVIPAGFSDGSYRVHATGTTQSAFDAFAAIISPNYEVGSQASIVGDNASLCNTTTPLVGDTVTITAPSSAIFSVYDAASGGLYAESSTVAAGGTFSFTVECATTYIASQASGGGSAD